MGRPLQALVLIVSLALGLWAAGCGGGGGGSTSATASPERDSAASRPSEAGGEQSNPAPPVPGSEAAAPGVPTSREGDNSIQTWGTEAPAAARLEGGRVVRSYARARVAGNWALACSTLAEKVKREQAHITGAPCADVMASSAADGTSAPDPQEAVFRVLSLRVGDGYAFLIYRRSDGIFATALIPEGNSFEVLSVTPTPIT
jgi:hypothetical protein